MAVYIFIILMLAWDLSSIDGQQHVEYSKAEFRLCMQVNAI